MLPHPGPLGKNSTLYIESLFVYSLDCSLRLTQQDFIYTTAAYIMVGGNKALPNGGNQDHSLVAGDHT